MLSLYLRAAVSVFLRFADVFGLCCPSFSGFFCMKSDPIKKKKKSTSKSNFFFFLGAEVLFSISVALLLMDLLL